MTTLISIAGSSNASGVHKFEALLSNGSFGSECRVLLSAGELLDYAEARRCLLERSGHVYVYQPADDKPAHQAGAMWRKFVAAMLVRAVHEAAERMQAAADAADCGEQECDGAAAN